MHKLRQTFFTTLVVPISRLLGFIIESRGEPLERVASIETHSDRVSQEIASTTKVGNVAFQGYSRGMVLAG